MMCSPWRYGPEVVRKRVFDSAEGVYQFPTCVALHGLRLAVPSIVIWATTFIASCCPVVGDVCATSSVNISSSSTAGAPNRTGARIWTVTCEVADLPTRIAAPTSGTAAQAQGRTVSLDVTQALTVVALFRCEWLIYCRMATTERLMAHFL